MHTVVVEKDGLEGFSKEWPYHFFKFLILFDAADNAWHYFRPVLFCENEVVLPEWNRPELTLHLADLHFNYLFFQLAFAGLTYRNKNSGINCPKK